MWPFGSPRRSIFLLCMQSLDTAIALRPKRKPLGGYRLQSQQDPERPNPTFIQAANDAAEWLAHETGGVALGSTLEAIANIPTTAHILGGAVIGASPADGVIDQNHRVFGDANLLVRDGAAVPANVGVNPALTITALAERAMSKIPPKEPARWTAPASAARPD